MKEIGKEHWGTAIYKGKEIENVTVKGKRVDADPSKPINEKPDRI